MGWIVNVGTSDTKDWPKIVIGSEPGFVGAAWLSLVDMLMREDMGDELGVVKSLERLLGPKSRSGGLDGGELELDKL